MEMWLWTDSTTLLAWTRNHKLWKKFVMERVNKIRELTPIDRWNDCPGVMNPGDLATHRLTGEQLSNSQLWLQGRNS